MKFKRIMALVFAVIFFIIPDLTSSVLSSDDFEKLDLIVELYGPTDGIALFSLDNKETIADNFDLEITETYDVVINGFTTQGTVADMKLLENNPAVKKVYIANTYTVPEDIETETVEEYMDYKPMSENGPVGTGMAVAVLDSEFLVAHKYFSQPVTSPKITSADISAKTSLGKIANGLYYSTKIPFVYDYYHEDKDVFNINSSHGTHVAGIVGGKNQERQGTAPDAQLVLMKIFSDEGETTDAKILRAIDDAILLGVDVINMSFGESVGFVNSQYNINYEDIISVAQSHGVAVCISNGNNGYLGGAGQNANSSYPSTEVTDYGSSATPATAPSAIAVGATDEQGIKTDYYSSRGAAHNLSLKPDISGIGRIKSSVSTSDISYSVMRGTSMASPYVSGSLASIKQYVSSAYPSLTNQQKTQIAEMLAMNTATLLEEDSGEYISPRAQGAGLVNAGNAATSPVIMYSSSDKGKVELYDNLSNSFSFDLFVKNLSNSDVSYNICCNVLTDEYDENTLRITGKSKAIENTTVTFDCGNTINLSAGEVKKITVSVTIEEETTDFLKQVFKNGFFIEGFVRLENALYPEVSVPFMGYFSDWGKQGFIDEGLIYNDMKIEGENGNILTKYSYEGGEEFVVLPEGGAIRLASVPFLRNIVKANELLTDISGNVLTTYPNVYYMKKSSYDYKEKEYLLYDLPWRNLKDSLGTDLGDGEYYYKVAGSIEYKDGIKTATPYCLRIVIDSQSPLADCVIKTDGNTALYYLRAQDNHAVKEVTVGSNTSEIGKASYNNIVETEISINGTEKITVSDYAGNTCFVTFSKGFICTYDNEGDLYNIIIKNIPINENSTPNIVIEPTDGNLNVRVLIWDNKLQPVYQG